MKKYILIILAISLLAACNQQTTEERLRNVILKADKQGRYFPGISHDSSVLKAFTYKPASLQDYYAEDTIGYNININTFKWRAFSSPYFTADEKQIYADSVRYFIALKQFVDSIIPHLDTAKNFFRVHFSIVNKQEKMENFETDDFIDKNNLKIFDVNVDSVYQAANNK